MRLSLVVLMSWHDENVASAIAARVCAWGGWLWSVVDDGRKGKRKGHGQRNGIKAIMYIVRRVLDGGK